MSEHVKIKSWDQFVLRHQNIWNIRIHFVSALFFWVSPILSIFVHPLYICGLFMSGLIGAFGHFVTKDGGVNFRETTSEPNVVRFSTKMAYLYVLGKYKNEINRVNKLCK